MLEIGVQTKNIVYDKDPAAGFLQMKEAGFTCGDFSLNAYLTNTSLYRQEQNVFFDQTEAQLERFFAPHKEGARAAGIRINQMHMPYPNYVPNGKKSLNDYLWNVVAPKSMKICGFFGCPYIVVHGFKLAKNLGSEEAEWQRTESFLRFLAPMAKELGITICIENVYSNSGSHIVEGPCCDARKAAERIDRINGDYGAQVLGFCFDTGHANLVGLDFWDFIRILGCRTISSDSLHLYQNQGKHGFYGLGRVDQRP